MSTLERSANIFEGCLNRIQVGCLGLVMNLLWVGFLGWGVYHAYTSWQLTSSGQSTTGVVVALDEHDSAEGGVTYAPIIEYDANGQTYSFTGGSASDPPAYRVGQEVSMLYDPANPEHAQIESWWELWLFPILIIPAMLIVAVVVNVALLIAIWRGRGLED